VVVDGLIAQARARTSELVQALDAAGLALQDLRTLRRWPAGLPELHRAWVVSMAHLIQALGAQEGIEANTAPRPVQIRLTEEAYRLVEQEQAWKPSWTGR
jgi:hypothetical protein